MNKLISIGALLLAATTSHAAVVISVNPLTQTASLGQQVNVDLTIEGLGDGVSVGTYDLDLAFDPNVLSFAGVNFGNQLDLFGLGDVQTTAPGTGTVNLFELSLDSIADLNSLQAPAFRLATVVFDTLSPANGSPLTLAINALGDAAGDPIAATVQYGAVSVSVVPLPEALWLLGPAIGGGLGFLRRRAA